VQKKSLLPYAQPDEEDVGTAAVNVVDDAGNVFRLKIAVAIPGDVRIVITVFDTCQRLG